MADMVDKTYQIPSFCRFRHFGSITYKGKDICKLLSVPLHGLTSRVVIILDEDEFSADKDREICELVL